MITVDEHQQWLDNPTGKIGKGEYCSACARFNSRNIACNAILLKDRQILLVKRAQDPQMGAWDIPGGYLDWNETLEECSSRELKEETGLVASPNDFKFFGTFSEPNNSAGNQVIEMYYVTKEFSGEIVLEEDEVLEAKWFSLDSLPENVAFDHRQTLDKLAQTL